MAGRSPRQCRSHALWPDESDSHGREIAAFFRGDTSILAEAFVAEDDGRLLGFAEVSIRPYAEGCESNRVAFLEGWYVEPFADRKSVV